MSNSENVKQKPQRAEKPEFSERFEKAMKICLEFEGGYVDNPYDAGGATNKGISLAFLKAAGLDLADLDRDGIRYEKVGDLNNDGSLDYKDVLLISEEYARRLYKAYFWDKVKADEFTADYIGIQVFDIAVNSGNYRAIQLLQRAVNYQKHGIAEDGIIGPLTLAAANRCEPRKLNNDLALARLNFYYQIVNSNPTQSIFLAGWSRRAKSFLINQ